MNRIGIALLAALIVSDPAYAGSPITVEDFVVDSSDYIGKDIAIRGLVMCTAMMADQDCSLTETSDATIQIDIDVSGMPRDARRKMLGCGIEKAMEGSQECRAVVTGRVVQAPFGPSLIASSLAWQ